MSIDLSFHLRIYESIHIDTHVLCIYACSVRKGTDTTNKDNYVYLYVYIYIYIYTYVCVSMHT